MLLMELVAVPYANQKFHLMKTSHMVEQTDADINVQ